MFLKILNRRQKELFLDLAIKAAESNGEVAQEEQTLLEAFAAEMEIPKRHETQARTQDILCALNAISSNRSRRIILFEMLGLMYTDAEYDATERDFIANIAQVFGISDETVENLREKVIAYAQVYSSICEAVLGPV